MWMTFFDKFMEKLAKKKSQL